MPRGARDLADERKIILRGEYATARILWRAWLADFDRPNRHPRHVRTGVPAIGLDSRPSSDGSPPHVTARRPRAYTRIAIRHPPGGLPPPRPLLPRESRPLRDQDAHAPDALAAAARR